jgi:hypothetical protein
LFEPVVRRMSDRSARETLASFKYLVEHGQPLSQPAKRLLPIPANC